MSKLKFELREAVAADLPDIFEQFAQVQSIHADAEPEFFRAPERDETFDKYFMEVLDDPEQRLVLACLDGKPAGHIQFFVGMRPKNIYQPERSFAFIRQLVVLEEFRQSGCGTALIDFAKSQAAKQGISLLGIDFWSFNGPARGCFEKAGFTVNQEHMWLRL